MAIQSTGANIVDALSAGLRGLTEWKMQEIQEKRALQNKEKARSFYKSQGLHPALADLPQTQQDMVLKEYLLREGYPQNQQQQPQGNKPFWSQGIQQNQQQGQTNDQQPGIQDLMAQLGGQQQDAQQGPQSGMDRLKSVLTEGALQDLLGQRNQVNPDFQPQNIPPQQQAPGMKPRRLTPEAESRERLSREKIAQNAEQFQQRTAQQEKHFEAKQQREKEKESRSIIKEIAEKKNALRSQRAALEKQKTLNDKALLDSPESIAIRNALGINYDFLKSPGTREFEGVGVSFLSNLKPFFGARPTNFDVQTYLKKLASTGDSPATRRALIRNYDLTLEADEALNNAKEQVIRANKGIAPHDLDLLAADLAEDKIDNIWKRFVNNTGTKELKAGSTLKADQLRPGMTIEVEGKPVKLTAENIGSFK